MADRRSKEFIDGVHEFIEAAEKHKYGCPCKFCKNEKDYSSSRTIHSHLFSSGFMLNYYILTKYEERGIIMDNNEEEEDKIPDFASNYGAFFYDTAMGEPEEDTEGHVISCKVRNPVLFFFIIFQYNSSFSMLGPNIVVRHEITIEQVTVDGS